MPTGVRPDLPPRACGASQVSRRFLCLAWLQLLLLFPLLSLTHLVPWKGLLRCQASDRSCPGIRQTKLHQTRLPRPAVTHRHVKTRFQSSGGSSHTRSCAPRQTEGKDVRHTLTASRMAASISAALAFGGVQLTQTVLSSLHALIEGGSLGSGAVWLA